MATPQGLIECSGLPRIEGGDFTLSRGIQPSVFRLRVIPNANQLQYIGPMTLKFGSESIVFENCATAPHVQRIWNGRKPFMWSVLAYDRRWLWRYPRLSGEYNQRLCDGSRQTSTQATLQELLAKLMEALGESGVTYRNVPTVYPYVNWNNNRADRELEHLLDMAGLVVWLGLNGKVFIDRIGSGDELPTKFRKITPDVQYRQSVKPSKVRVTAGPTHYQLQLELEAVGLDTNGSIKPIDTLSYTPSTGWSTQWYTLFSDVTPAYRHLAFQSVFRWYRLKANITLPGMSEAISSLAQIQLFEKLAEEAEDSLGIKRCLDGVIRGTFWPQSDHPKNTSANTFYPGPFTIRPDLHLVAFEYPVIQFDSGGVLPATLYLATSLTVRTANGSFVSASITRDVTNSTSVTSPRVEKRSYLKHVRNSYPVYGIATDNLSDVEAEANAYIDNLVETYADTREIDHIYGGLVPVELSGKVAQVRWRWGNGRVATTRASMGHEFDVTVPTHQARRRQERLGQLAERVLDL